MHLLWNGLQQENQEGKMLELDYTKQGRRPSAKQIVNDWNTAGKPLDFTAEYGETYAHFNFSLMSRRWNADGNGCSGIKRDDVERLLNASL
jgi:hypothetical protein